jgi:hypothetical protein
VINWHFSQLVFKAALILSVIVAGERHAFGLGSGDSGFGQQWIRDNPFVIMGHSPVYLNTPNGAGVYWQTNHTYLATDSTNPSSDLVRGWTEPYGNKPAFRYRPQSSWSRWLRLRVEWDLSHIPTLQGFMLKDEPTISEMDTLATVAANIRAISTEKLVWVNMSGETANDFPGQFDHLQATVNPDVLMYDQYPFWTDGTTIPSYYETLMKVRNRGLVENKPYWAYLQSFATSGHRAPSASDMRMNAYTHLTAGYTGLDYWTQTKWDAFDSGLQDAAGSPTAMYFVAQTLNLEVQKLGRTLRFLSSNAVRFVPGKNGAANLKNPTPQGLIDWSIGAGGETRILSIGVDLSSPANKGIGKDGLIGLFTGDDGKTYFMLTNLNHAANQSESATSLDFRMAFSASVNELLRLNRLTGEPEKVILNNHVLNLTLPGGTGDLFKFNDGMFEGIQPGDADLDGDVDLSDLSVLASYYGAISNGRWSKGDFDLDSDVDLSDLSVLAANYGTGQAQAMSDFAMLSSVPEPSIFGMIAISGLFLLFARARVSIC